MAAWGSTTARKRPRFRRRRLLELRSTRITEDASPTELTQRHLEDQIYAFHRIERDWKTDRVNDRSRILNVWLSSGNDTNTSLKTDHLVDQVHN